MSADRLREAAKHALAALRRTGPGSVAEELEAALAASDAPLAMALATDVAKNCCDGQCKFSHRTPEDILALLAGWPTRLALAASDAPAPQFEPLLTDLTHTRSCPALTPGDDDCTCGLIWRVRLRTEMEMHNAWRKRAEEDETVVEPMKHALEFIVAQENLTFAECSLAEEIVLRAKKAIGLFTAEQPPAAVAEGGEK